MIDEEESRRMTALAIELAKEEQRLRTAVRADSQEKHKVAEEKEMRQQSGPMTGTKEGEMLDKIISSLGSLNERLDDIEAEEKKMQKMDDHDRRRRDKGQRRRSSDDDDFYSKRRDDDDIDAAHELLEEAIAQGDPEEIRKAHEYLKECTDDMRKHDDARRRHDDDDDDASPRYRRTVKGLDDDDREMRRRHDDDDDRRDDRRLALHDLTPLARKARRDAQLHERQARADAVCSAFGNSAPPPMQGEYVYNYRLRLAKLLQGYSKEFGNVDLRRLEPEVFDGIEKRIYADAQAASKDPNVLAASGTLREVKRVSDSGHVIREF